MLLWLPPLSETHNSEKTTTLHCVSTAKLVKSQSLGSGIWKRICVSVAYGSSPKKGKYVHAVMRVDQRLACCFGSGVYYGNAYARRGVRAMAVERGRKTCCLGGCMAVYCALLLKPMRRLRGWRGCLRVRIRSEAQHHRSAEEEEEEEWPL